MKVGFVDQFMESDVKYVEEIVAVLKRLVILVMLGWRFFFMISWLSLTWKL